MTPFAITVFYLLTMLNNAGQLAPVEKADLPAPYTSPFAFSEGQCFIIRGRMAEPEKYFCQRFASAPEANWKPPQAQSSGR